MTQEDVLRAEQMVRDLAAEMARAKGIADGVESIQSRLAEAEKALQLARDAFVEAKGQLEEARAALERTAGTAEQQLNQAATVVERLYAGVADLSGEVARQVESVIQAQERLAGTLGAVGSELREQMGLIRDGLGVVTDAIEAVADLAKASRAEVEQLSGSITEKVEALSKAHDNLLLRLDEVQRVVRRQALRVTALGICTVVLLLILVLLSFILP